MSFELDILNFWIHNLSFTIKNDKLYMCLKASDNDFMNCCDLFLSDNHKDILEFFGFDTSVDYLNLKSYNVYEFFCTTSKLSPHHISYCGFKGPHPKNQNHSNFNVYVKKKFQDIRTLEEGSDTVRSQKVTWLKSALDSFSKQKEYQKYLWQKATINVAINTLHTLHASFSDMSRFILLHGIKKIVKWEDDILKAKWKKFKDDEWNGLTVFTYR